MDKNNMIMVVVVTVLAIVYFSTKSTNVDNSVQINNVDLLGFTEGSLAKIVITENAASLTIYQKDGIWVVKEKYDYPAVNQKIKETLEKIFLIRGDSFYTKEKSSHHEFELVDPAEANAKGYGIRIELFSKEDKLLASLILGKTKTNNQPDQMPFMATQSQFIRKTGDDSVFLSNNTLQVSAAPSNWIEKKALNIKKDLVREIQVTMNDKSAYTLQRTEPKSNLALTEIQEGFKPVSSQIDSMARNAEDLNIDSVLNIEDAAKHEFPHTYTIKSFEGLIYTFKFTDPLAEENQQFCLSVEASLDLDYINADLDLPEETKKEIRRLTVDQAKAFVNEFNDKHKHWRYILASWVGKKFMKDLSMLIEAEKKEEPVEDEETTTTPALEQE